tara:strand:+ start:1946 stop:3109 length:1164 start_codon:yes stop_codon:yes gene_type:complete
MLINESTWPGFASSIATNGDPMLHSPAAIERYMGIMKPYIKNVRAPHGKHKAINRCQLIDFLDDSERATYQRALEDMMAKYERLQKEMPADAKFQEFLIQGEFRRRAELIRAKLFAIKMKDAVDNGYAAVSACCYRPTVARVVRSLSALGVKRDDISLIWGGNNLFAKDKRLTEQQIAALVYRLAKGEVLPAKDLKQLYAQISESEEQKAEANNTYTEDLRLGSQSREERQKEIDRFQRGKSLYCLFTFAAGGVGLSLHHTDKDRKGRLVELRPRKSFLTPTYSAQEFVQGLGRAHRSVFSLSNTEQTILFYKDTVEEHVMARVSLKLKCLSKVVMAKESWADAVWNSSKVDKEERDEQLRREQDSHLPDEDGVELDDITTDEEDED